MAQQQPRKNMPPPIGARLIEAGGIVYNMEHVVKVDCRREKYAAIHTTTGIDEFHEAIGEQVRRYFSPDATPVVPIAETKGKMAS